MRFRQIEVFHAIYTNGSISAAARALNISQPSVSKMLHHAEDQLGFRLFQLVRGRLVATDEAHALFREAGDLFERLSSLQQTARNLRSAGGGHIRLAVVPSLGLAVTAGAVAKFRETHPRVTFDLQTLHHENLFRALHERECDLALAHEPPAHPRLEAKTIATGELVMLYRRADFDLPQERLPLTFLKGRELIGVTSSGPIGELFTLTAERMGIGARHSISVQTFYLAASLVQRGAGLSVVDEFTARAWRSPEVDFRFIDPPLRFSVKCVTLHERPLSRTASKFVDTIAEELREKSQDSSP